jgi:hypothetical protein
MLRTDGADDHLDGVGFRAARTYPFTTNAT